MEPTQFEKLKKEGNEHFHNQSYSKAFDLYTKAIGLATNTEQLAVIYSNRSNASLKMNKLEDALLDINKAIFYKPTWSKALYRKADILSKLGRYFDAIGILINAKSHASGAELLDIEKLIIEVCHKNNQQVFRLMTEEMREELDYLKLRGMNFDHVNAFLSLGLYYGIPEGVLSYEKVIRWLKFGRKYGVGDGQKVYELLDECERNEQDRTQIMQFIIKFYTDRYIYR